MVDVGMDHIYHVLAGLSALAAFWWRYASSKKEKTAEYKFYLTVAGTAAVVILGNEAQKWLSTLLTMIM